MANWSGSALSEAAPLEDLGGFHYICRSIKKYG